MDSLNDLGRTFVDRWQRLRLHNSESAKAEAVKEKINVVGAGGTLTAAYEQLRNVAENTEEHLLLQNAIRRFYRQLFVTRDESLIYQSGNELAVELTLAGYTQNDSLTKDQARDISSLAVKYYRAYEQFLGNRSVSSDRAMKWTLDVLAVEAESIINDHLSEAVFAEFAYAQLDRLIASDPSVKRTDDTPAALYIAVYEALLKSNNATVRANLLRRYGARIEDLDGYIDQNQKIDKLFDSTELDSLYRIVDRQSPPLRIFRHMIEERDEVDTLLVNRTNFLGEYEKQIALEYDRVSTKLNRAIVRSIIFLIITKFIVGLAIEVPYDYLAHGRIIWLPLIINLLFPPLYMLALRATLQLPGYANTRALVDRMDAMLYGTSESLAKVNTKSRSYGPVFSAVYGILGILVFAAVMYGLLLIGFSIVHILIFFVFLSAASFLGFRLSRSIREIEIVRGAQSGMTFVRDMLYLPFVVVGQWMSDKYSRVNVVTIVLDMLIELPMKTILRLVRQWAAFIDDQKDRI